MRTVRDIEALLDELDIHVADELEDQDLDFKQWDTVSMDKSVRLFLRMRSDTEYDIREDRVTALPISIARCEELLQPLNPITTVERGMYHFEYQTYPQVAFREALMKPFSHADYRIAGPVMVKLYADCLTISNNGGFIGGISPANILHHQSAARNPLLVEALTRLRFVNRSILGVTRMFTAFLLEGKRPPIIQEIGEPSETDGCRAFRKMGNHTTRIGSFSGSNGLHGLSASPIGSALLLGPIKCVSNPARAGGGSRTSRRSLLAKTDSFAVSVLCPSGF